MIIEHCNCNLCGGNDYDVIWDKTEREQHGALTSKVIRDKDGNIVQGRNVCCKTCGLVYITPRMDKESLDGFYKTTYREIYAPVSEDGERHHADHAARYVQALWKNGKKLLDIGCSKGYLLEACRDMGYITYGVEPSEHALEAAKHGNIFPTIDDVVGQFDVITLMNTIEHFRDPLYELQKIRKLLKPDGHLLLSAPNLLNNWCNTTMDGWFSNAHLYSFTPHTLTALLTKAGFDVAYARPEFEMMGEKMYFILTPDEPKEPKYKPINLERLKNRLQCQDYLVLSKEVVYD